MKFLILLLIIGGIFYYLRSRTRAFTSPKSPKQRTTTTINMVQCEHCGVHLPENEAIIRQGHTWCCEEHARLDSH